MGIGINIKTTGNQITKLEFDIWELEFPVPSSFLILAFERELR